MSYDSSTLSTNRFKFYMRKFFKVSIKNTAYAVLRKCKLSGDEVTLKTSCLEKRYDLIKG